MPNVTHDPYNNGAPGKANVGSSLHEAVQSAHMEAMCGTRVVGKLERINKSLDSIEKLDVDFRVLVQELDHKLGNAPTMPTVGTVACGGAGEKSPSSVPSLESSVCRLTSLEERVSRNISRLRSLINSL